MSDSSNGETGVLIPISREDYLKTKQINNKKLKITYIKLDQLQYFKDHPFKLYEGNRLDNLIQSIKQKGIMQPIHVRCISEGKYEILSGHNRVNASKEAGIDEIPAIIHDGISDEDARILVVDSNFEQRHLDEIKHSEFANALHMLNEAMKKKSGFRSDKIKSVEDMDADNRLRTMEVIGNKYGMSKVAVARYIRIAYLIKELQEELDNKKMGLGVAEQLSYLKESEQSLVEALVKTNIKINTEQARALRKASESSKEKPLDKATINKIFEPKESEIRVSSIKLNKNFLSQFFDDKHSKEDILNTIAKALEQYHSNQNI